MIEEGWYCEVGNAYDTTDATECYEVPMDGLDFGRYPCDVVEGSTDGCYDSEIQDGWDCTGGSRTTPDTCTEICGDGYHFNTDASLCDDGNFVDLDGCSSSCESEDGFYEDGDAPEYEA